MPLVLPEAKLVFLHIPKTGGNWVIVALRELGVSFFEVEGSETFADTKNLYPEFTRFTVVRNPLTWYPSYWANCQIFGCGGLSCLDICPDCEQNLGSFYNYVNSVLRNHPSYLVGLYSKYTLPGVKVLRTETLAQGLSNLLDSVGTYYDRCKIFDIAHANRCASQPQYAKRISYTESIRKRVVESEALLFEKYGFDSEVVV